MLEPSVRVLGYADRETARPFLPGYLRIIGLTYPPRPLLKHQIVLVKQPSPKAVSVEQAGIEYWQKGTAREWHILNDPTGLAPVVSVIRIHHSCRPNKKVQFALASDVGFPPGHIPD